MIILDTNVISEAIRKQPDPKIISWIDEQKTMELHLCAPVIAELQYGVSKLPESKRQRDLARRVAELAIEPFRGRVLPFDFAAAELFGPMVADRERRGRPIQLMDAMIAAIVLDHNARIATRNVSDFEFLDLDLINPFD